MTPSIINLTPHDVHVYKPGSDSDTPYRTYPASGQVARVAVKTHPFDTLDGVLLVHSHFGEITGLPEADYKLPEVQPKVYYIVSLVTLQALRNKGFYRLDLLVPDTGAGAVRNAHGELIGVTQFILGGTQHG